MYQDWTAIEKVLSVTDARRRFCQGQVAREVFPVWEEAIDPLREGERKDVSPVVGCVACVLEGSVRSRFALATSKAM